MHLYIFFSMQIVMHVLFPFGLWKRLKHKLHSLSTVHHLIVLE